MERTIQKSDTDICNGYLTTMQSRRQQMDKFRDAIIVCPTHRAAVMTWKRFVNSFKPAIKSANKQKMTITMKNGQKMILVSSQMGRKMFIGDPRDFITFSLEVFETMYQKHWRKK